MSVLWYEPRRKLGSLSPRVSITKKYISLNPPCIEKYFKDTSYAKIGYDTTNKKLFIVPVQQTDNYKMKLIRNTNSKQVYLNASNFLESAKLSSDKRLVFKCSWDDTAKGILIDLNTDKVT